MAGEDGRATDAVTRAGDGVGIGGRSYRPEGRQTCAIDIRETLCMTQCHFLLFTKQIGPQFYEGAVDVNKYKPTTTGKF